MNFVIWKLVNDKYISPEIIQAYNAYEACLKYCIKNPLNDNVILKVMPLDDGGVIYEYEIKLEKHYEVNFKSQSCIQK